MPAASTSICKAALLSCRLSIIIATTTMEEEEASSSSSSLMAAINNNNNLATRQHNHINNLLTKPLLLHKLITKTTSWNS